VQLCCGIAGDHAASRHEDAGRAGPQREVGVQRGGRVDVREQPLLPPAQDPGCEQPGCYGGRAAKGGGEVGEHGAPDGSGDVGVP
jgi:hypothetical protein